MEKLEIDVLEKNDPEHWNQPNPYEQHVCYCGCNQFRVYGGYYETSVECIECGNRTIVHDG